MKIAVAQLGARRHYAVPRILHRAGALAKVYTDIYAGSRPWLASLVRATPRPILPERFVHWLARDAPDIPKEKVKTFEEIGLMRPPRNVSTDLAARASWLAHRNQRFCELIIRSRPADVDVIYAYSGAALELFQWAKSRGIICVLDQTVASQRLFWNLHREEEDRWPHWTTKPAPPAKSDNRLAIREEEEWRLADLILCGSNFVLNSLLQSGASKAKCRVVPTGVDLSSFTPKTKCDETPVASKNVLFVGEVGLRKGVPYFLEALASLRGTKITAKFAGGIAIVPDRVTMYREIAHFLGAVPRSRMAALYQWADMLVLPSVCEGSAIVTYEAAASMIPVICTPNSGPLAGPLMTIVPHGDIEALAAALRQVPSHTMDADAAKRTRDEYGLEAYARRFKTAIGLTNEKQ